jgi:DNA invertase Pin-like site-specific DNA recombinase
LEAQIRELEKAGCERIFREQVSSVGERSQLAATLEFLREGDLLIVTKLDRLARSVVHVVEITERVAAKALTFKF